MSVVAIVEAEGTIHRRLSHALDEAGLSVMEASDGLAALRLIFNVRPQVCLLDASVPGMDSLDLLRILRGACDVPVIAMVRDLGSRMTVRLLDAGADDVVPTEVDPRELIARIRSSIRSHERYVTMPEDQEVVRTGDITIDRASRTVTKRGAPVHLSRTEFRLLDALASRLGQLAPHKLLLSTVWGDAYIDDTHYLRVYFGYLRKKLEDVPSAPEYLVNEWGVGYRLAARPFAVTVPPALALSA